MTFKKTISNYYKSPPPEINPNTLLQNLMTYLQMCVACRPFAPGV